MEIGTINPHVMKIIISSRKEDSVNAISKRIKLSYGWTYYWVQKLMRAGVFKRKGHKIYLQEISKFYRDTIKYIKTAFANDVAFHYAVLDLFGIKYCFTKTDAVFVWTRGGYNIGRYKYYYPIFIKLQKSDKELFEYYTEKLGVIEKKNIFYSVEILEDFKVIYNKGIPVDSLQETINFMKKYIYNFQPALEMIKEMYGKKLEVKYKEVVSNV